MAKSRRNRGGAVHRRDPMVKASKPPTDASLAALHEATILPVVQDLRSAEPRARTAAASAVANLVQDSACRKLLLREQVVHVVLTQTLTDAALESRAAGWGVLQLLVQEEAADFCVHLFRQDILMAMEHAARTTVDRLGATASALSALPKAEQGFLTSIAASLLSLASALAEAGEDIFEAVAGSNALYQLLSFLISHQIHGPDDRIVGLRTDALACLMILCEDNQQLACRVVLSDNGSCFRALMVIKNETGCDRVLACAALHNIFVAAAASRDAAQVIGGTDDSVLVPTLTSVSASITQPVAGGGPCDGGWSSLFEQQQLALETLASIGTNLHSTALDGDATDDDNPAVAPRRRRTRGDAMSDENGAEDDEEMGDADELGSDAADEGLHESDNADGQGAPDDGDDEMGQGDLMADMEMVTGADDATDGDLDNLPVLKALLQTALPQLMRLGCLQPSVEEDVKLHRLVLSALNNIAWALSLIDFADSSNVGIQRAWVPVARSLWEHVVAPVLVADTADVDLAAHVTGLAWAVARSLRGQLPLADGAHERFMALYRATQGAPSMRVARAGDALQSLGVKCVGVLGQLALDPAPIARNSDIGDFLVGLAVALPATPVADAVEAVDQLFDVYGDDTCACDAAVFWPAGFLACLQDALPKLRTAAKTVNKKAAPDLRARADEAVFNLARFIAYKKNTSRRRRRHDVRA